MKSPFCIAPLLLLHFTNLTWALPWDPPTCPLPAPPPSPAQHVLSPDVGADGNSTEKKTNLVPTKVIKLLLPRQTAACLRVMCDSQYYCCNDQTCSNRLTKWVCLWATRTVTITSTYQSTTTVIATTTRSITTTTWDTVTVWTHVSSTDLWTTAVTVTNTPTQTSFTTTTVTLRGRGMPTPTRCVRRPEEEERRRGGLAKRADYTYYVTTTIVVTATPSTLYLTTTWLYTYWITGQTTTTRTTYINADRTTTVTETNWAPTTTTTFVFETTTRIPKLTPDQKVGIGVGSGVGGLAIIALVVALIWKKCMKSRAAEAWASNQPVEDRNVPPGGAGHGMAMFGAGGKVLAAGETYKGPYKAGFYGQDGNVVITETPSSPPPAHFQQAQYPQGYPELGPSDIHSIPRRPVPGSSAPPSYRG